MVFLLTKGQKTGLAIGSGVVLAGSVASSVLIDRDIITLDFIKNNKQYFNYGLLGASVITSALFGAALSANVVKVNNS